MAALLSSSQEDEALLAAIGDPVSPSSPGLAASDNREVMRHATSAMPTAVKCTPLQQSGASSASVRRSEIDNQCVHLDDFDHASLDAPNRCTANPDKPSRKRLDIGSVSHSQHAESRDDHGPVMQCLEALCSLACAQRKLLAAASPVMTATSYHSSEFTVARRRVASAAEASINVLPVGMVQLLRELSEVPSHGAQGSGPHERNASMPSFSNASVFPGWLGNGSADADHHALSSMRQSTVGPAPEFPRPMDDGHASVDNHGFSSTGPDALKKKGNGKGKRKKVPPVDSGIPNSGSATADDRAFPSIGLASDRKAHDSTRIGAPDLRKGEPPSNSTDHLSWVRDPGQGHSVEARDLRDHSSRTPSSNKSEVQRVGRSSEMHCQEQQTSHGKMPAHSTVSKEPRPCAMTSSSQHSSAAQMLIIEGEELEPVVSDFIVRVRSGQKAASSRIVEQHGNRQWFADNFEWTRDVKVLLQERFGHSSFRGFQLPVINAILSGKDVFGVMPTGAGKSLCYQIPALYRHGTAVVISPLLALMLDQVQALQKHGIAAARLGSDGNKTTEDQALADLDSGRLQLLYVSPERIVSSSEHRQRLTRALRGLHTNKRLSFFVIDEAHCVSQWGLDFRSQYRQLSCIRRDFPGVPILALTASATRSVEKDVIKSLRMKAPETFRDTFDRPNIFMECRIKKSEAQAVKEMAMLARSGGNMTLCGIVYVLSRDETERLAEMLRNEGVNAMPYHAGLSGPIRKERHRAWMEGDFQVMIATIAFGMGIDKKDVRFVCHSVMTSSIERYHQEIGRAGRDGGPCRCIVWHSPADLKRLKAVTTKKNELQKIEEACQFFSCADQCRRKALLKHFEEQGADNCGSCDICARQFLGIAPKLEEQDFTEQAHVLLALATALAPLGLTAAQLRDVARGKSLSCKSNKLADEAANHPHKGVLANFKIELVDQLIQQMLVLKIFSEHRLISRGRRRFHRSIMQVRLGSKAGQLRAGSLKVTLQLDDTQAPSAAAASRKTTAVSESPRSQAEPSCSSLENASPKTPQRTSFRCAPPAENNLPYQTSSEPIAMLSPATSSDKGKNQGRGRVRESEVGQSWLTAKRMRTGSSGPSLRRAPQRNAEPLSVAAIAQAIGDELVTLGFRTPPVASNPSSATVDRNAHSSTAPAAAIPASSERASANAGARSSPQNVLDYRSIPQDGAAANTMHAAARCDDTALRNNIGSSSAHPQTSAPAVQLSRAAQRNQLRWNVVPSGT